MMLTPRTYRVFLSYPLTSCLIIIIIIIASKTQTEKKLHRINKVTKRKKKTNSEFTHLHVNTHKY